MHEKNLSGFQDLYCLQFTFTESNVNEVVSAQFRRSVVSDSLQPHESQHARPPCPSPTPGVDSNSCPSSRWCSPAISSSVLPFSCLPSFPASGSFPVSQFFSSGGPSIGVSASASVLPINTQDWSPLGWTGWISLQFKGLARVFPSIRIFSSESVLCIRWPKYWNFSFSISPSNEHQDWSPLEWTGWTIHLNWCSKASILWHSAFFTVQLSYPYVTIGKTVALTNCITG